MRQPLSLMRAAIGTVLLASLVACGGSSNDSVVGTAGATAASATGGANASSSGTSTQAGSTFLAAVMRMMTVESNTAEPVSIDSMTATGVDNAEAQPLS